jgi:hypothetical protein
MNLNFFDGAFGLNFRFMVIVPPIYGSIEKEVLRSGTVAAGFIEFRVTCVTSILLELGKGVVCVLCCPLRYALVSSNINMSSPNYPSG